MTASIFYYRMKLELDLSGVELRRVWSESKTGNTEVLMVSETVDSLECTPKPVCLALAS